MPGFFSGVNSKDSYKKNGGFCSFFIRPPLQPRRSERKTLRAKIIGTGSYLPEKIATNDFLSTIVDTSDEWIKTRTGIENRHLVSGDETSAYMACKAAERALSDAGVKAEDIDLIIVATCTSDTLVPSTACDIQGRLGAVNAAAFDVNAACSGFVYALSIADSFFQNGVYKNALVVGVETLSRIVDWSDRSTCVLFADGAGAAVVKACETGIISFDMGANGQKGDALKVKNRENNNPFDPGEKPMDHLYMDGQAVFKFAVRTVPKSIKRTLEKAQLSASDIDYFLLHQSNIRINKDIAQMLKVPIEKFPSNIASCGNTSGASIPILLDEKRREGLLKEGDAVVLAGFGAGLTWASCALKL